MLKKQPQMGFNVASFKIFQLCFMQAMRKHIHATTPKGFNIDSPQSDPEGVATGGNNPRKK